MQLAFKNKQDALKHWFTNSIISPHQLAFHNPEISRYTNIGTEGLIIISGGPTEITLISSFVDYKGDY